MKLSTVRETYRSLASLTKKEVNCHPSIYPLPLIGPAVLRNSEFSGRRYDFPLRDRGLDYDLIFARCQFARVNQSSSVSHGCPASSISASPSKYFSSILPRAKQRVLNVDRGPQGGLIDAGVVDLKVNSDGATLMVDTG